MRGRERRKERYGNSDEQDMVRFKTSQPISIEQQLPNRGRQRKHGMVSK